MIELFPIRFQIPGQDEAVKVAYCPPFIGAIGNSPPYWYVTRQMMMWDGPTEKYYKQESHLNAWYYTECGWAACSPKQFITAQQAAEFYVNSSPMMKESFKR
jgi:hypothetical protein